MSSSGTETASETSGAAAASGSAKEARRARREAAAALAAELKKLPQRYERDVDLRTLEDYPGNPKEHDIGAIHDSMATTGVYGVLYVQEWDGEPRYIVAGHGRKDTLLAAGVTTMDVIFIAVDPAGARRIVLADNRVAQLGGYDDDRTLALLRLAMQTEVGLRGTGYDDDDANRLLRLAMPTDATRFLERFQPTGLPSDDERAAAAAAAPAALPQLGGAPGQPGVTVVHGAEFFPVSFQLQSGQRETVARALGAARQSDPALATAADALAAICDYYLSAGGHGEATEASEAA